MGVASALVKWCVLLDFSAEQVAVATVATAPLPVAVHLSCCSLPRSIRVHNFMFHCFHTVANLSFDVTHGRPHPGQQAGRHCRARRRRPGPRGPILGPSTAASCAPGAAARRGSRTPAPTAVPLAALAPVFAAAAAPPLTAPAALPAAAPAAALLVPPVVAPPLGAPAAAAAPAAAGTAAAARLMPPLTAAVAARAAATPAAAAAAVRLCRGCAGTQRTPCRCRLGRSACAGRRGPRLCGQLPGCLGCFSGSNPIADALQMHGCRTGRGLSRGIRCWPSCLPVPLTSAERRTVLRQGLSWPRRPRRRRLLLPPRLLLLLPLGGPRLCCPGCRLRRLVPHPGDTGRARAAA